MIYNLNVRLVLQLYGNDQRLLCLSQRPVRNANYDIVVELKTDYCHKKRFSLQIRKENVATGFSVDCVVELLSVPMLWDFSARKSGH